MTASAPKPRIILADDHRPMLEEISKLLEREFEIVAAVADGALAVKHVADLKPDAVLLDIHMPGMGGMEAAQQLRRLGSSAKIVFLTIESDPDDYNERQLRSQIPYAPRPVNCDQRGTSRTLIRFLDLGSVAAALDLQVSPTDDANVQSTAAYCE